MLLEKFQSTINLYNMKLIKYIFPLVILLISCSSETKQIENNVIIPPAKIEPKDYYKFKHLLPEGDLSYNIEISEIDFKMHKDAFSIAKNKYDVPGKSDGLTLTLKYKMTNPYNKSMQIPFPEYYYVTSNEFEGLEKFEYFKGCRCHSNSMTEIKNSNGKGIYDFTIDDNDGISRQRLIEFKPNETQEFTITFTEPFPNSVNSITFVGFDEHLHKEVDFSVYEKMSEAEREANEAKKYALIINVASKKITNRTIVKS